MENEIIFAIIGIFAGVFAGMGMGGGTFLIPLLVLICSFSQIQAQSVNLFAFIPMAIIALIIHMKNKLINYKVGLVVILFASFGTFVGVWILGFVELFVLKLFYALFLLCVGVWILIGAIKTRKNIK